MENTYFATPQTNENNPAHISFQEKEIREDGIVYVFDRVLVKIDTSGKNYKDLPEILFGTFDVKPTKDIFNQPETKREGMDMSYVAQCIKEVASDSQIHTFWFYPFGDDVENKEEQKSREEARFRLFKKMGDISSTSNGYGYILKV